jgi:RNA polymerase sigma-70 factor (ECF subfamily)
MATGEWLADREPESEARLADSVELALLVVLEALEPAERLAFVLRCVFGMTCDEIAPIADCSPAAARQLVSRARSRVRNILADPERLRRD